MNSGKLHVFYTISYANFQGKPGDFVAVMSMDANGALRVNQGFTSDQGLVAKAIQDLAHARTIPKFPTADVRVQAQADAIGTLAPMAGRKTLVMLTSWPNLSETASPEQWRYLAESDQASNVMPAALMFNTGRSFGTFVTALGHAPYTYVVPIGNTVLAKPDSTYPYAAEELAPGIKGNVEFGVTIGPDGRVKDAHFVSGNPSLELEAREVLGRTVQQGLAGRETKADVQFILDRRPASRPPDAYDAKDTTAGFRVNQDPDCPPTLLRTVEPDYPLELRASGLQGIVELAATVGADGVPTDVQVVRAPGSGADTEALKAAAVNAAGQWRFAPARDYGGQPVAVPVTIQMTFRLL